jgi:hypothetical protein
MGASSGSARAGVRVGGHLAAKQPVIKLPPTTGGETTGGEDPRPVSRRKWTILR